MMLKRLKGAAVGCVALAIASTALYAAGNYSMYPIVGFPSFCASTVSGAGGFNAAGNTNNVNPTGQGQATSGSICAQTVPAGPPIVTGNELVPADTGAGSGVNPQTVTLSLASLNSLPLTVSSVPTSTLTSLSATNITGGYIVHNASGTITAVTVNLPPAPIDGQQFALSADQTITTLIVTPTTAGQTVSKAPTVLTPSTTASYGYRFSYNAALLTWFRLQ